ncbi:MAG: VF530 family DNA-binding protein [Bacteroidota bacterium]
MAQDPLHGITLERIITELQEEFGWEQLAEKIRINCFYENPSVSSSLKFLRKTPWARKKVEDLYIYTVIKKRTK